MVVPSLQFTKQVYSGKIRLPYELEERRENENQSRMSYYQLNAKVKKLNADRRGTRRSS